MINATRTGILNGGGKEGEAVGTRAFIVAGDDRRRAAIVSALHARLGEREDRIYHTSLDPCIRVRHRIGHRAIDRYTPGKAQAGIVTLIGLTDRF